LHNYYFILFCIKFFLQCLLWFVINNIICSLHIFCFINLIIISTFLSRQSAFTWTVSTEAIYKLSSVFYNVLRSTPCGYSHSYDTVSNHSIHIIKYRLFNRVESVFKIFRRPSHLPIFCIITVTKLNIFRGWKSIRSFLSYARDNKKEMQIYSLFSYLVKNIWSEFWGRYSFFFLLCLI